MTIEKLREIIHTQPFQAFIIRTADGRSVPVPHPDFISISPPNRMIHVFHKDGRSEFIDALLVTSVELGNGRSRRTPRKRPPGR